MPLLVGAMIAGSMMSAYGSLQQGEAQYQAGQYNAQIALQNAELSRQQAAEEERKQRLFAKKTIGSMRANFGASGVSLDGSAQDVIEDSAATAELDALMIRHQGEARAISFENEARLARYGAGAGRTAGQFGAVGSLLGSARMFVGNSKSGGGLTSSSASGGGYGTAGASYSNYSNIA